MSAISLFRRYRLPMLAPHRLVDIQITVACLRPAVSPCLLSKSQSHDPDPGARHFGAAGCPSPRVFLAHAQRVTTLPPPPRTQAISARRKMPPPKKRAASKESVIYPPSKRKAPPFKPQRPGKYAAVAVLRGEASTIDEEANARVRREEEDAMSELSEDEDEDEDDEDELDDDPLVTKPRRTALPGNRKNQPYHSTVPDPLPHQPRAKSRPHSMPPPPPPPPLPSSPPPLPPSSTAPQVPTPLLLRLLHEKFASPTTQITVPALDVVRAYLEVFLREVIARAALSKRERPGVAEDDRKWLELEDLERVVVGVVMDF